MESSEISEGHNVAFHGAGCGFFGRILLRASGKNLTLSTSRDQTEILSVPQRSSA